jgi:hypothetical protein
VGQARFELGGAAEAVERRLVPEGCGRTEVGNTGRALQGARRGQNFPIDARQRFLAQRAADRLHVRQHLGFTMRHEDRRRVATILGLADLLRDCGAFLQQPRDLFAQPDQAGAQRL